MSRLAELAKTGKECELGMASSEDGAAAGAPFVMPQLRST